METEKKANSKRKVEIYFTGFRFSVLILQLETNGLRTLLFMTERTSSLGGARHCSRQGAPGLQTLLPTHRILRFI